MPKRAQTLSRVPPLGLLRDVVLSDRTQQGDEHAESSEDVDDREDPRFIAGRVEVSVAHGGQGHDREVEELDEAPVLEAPVEDCPREHQRPATKGKALVSGSRQTATIVRARPRNARRSEITGGALFATSVGRPSRDRTALLRELLVSETRRGPRARRRARLLPAERERVHRGERNRRQPPRLFVSRSSPDSGGSACFASTRSRPARASRRPRACLATGSAIGDDRVVPNCYHVSSSSPEETARDVQACVNEVGGPGKLGSIAKDAAGRVHSLVYYTGRDDADRYLLPITRCLRSKGHSVHRAEVLEDVEDFPRFGTNEPETSA